MLDRNPLLVLFLSFTAGLILSDLIPIHCSFHADSISWSPLSLIAPSLLVWGQVIRIRGMWRAQRRSIGIICLLPALLAGAIHGRQARQAIPADYPDPSQRPDHWWGIPIQEPAWFTGEVIQAADFGCRGYTLLICLRDWTTSTGGVRHSVCCRIRLRCPIGAVGCEMNTVLPGDTVRFFTAMRVPSNFLNPDGFDYRKYLLSRHISLTATLKDPRLLKIIPTTINGLRCFDRSAARCRRWIDRTIASRFPGTGAAVSEPSGEQKPGHPDETGALLSACLTGSRGWIPATTMKIMRDAGLAHILAISGLHLGLIGMMMNRVLVWIRVQRVPRMILLIILFLFYLQMTGGGPSVRRAVIMALFCLGGRLFGFRSSLLNPLAAAGLFILGSHPLQLSSPGFLFSFTATAAILAGSPHIPRPIKNGGMKERLINRLKSALFISVTVFVALMPLEAMFFNRLCPMAAFVNLFACPLLAIALVSSLVWLTAEAAISCVNGTSEVFPTLIAEPGRVISQLSIESINRLAELAAPSAIHIPDPTPGLVFCYVFCILIAGARLTIKGRLDTATRFIIIVAVGGFLSVSLCGLGRTHAGLLRVTFLDVGNGDSACIECPDGRSFVIDAGGADPQGLDFGENVVTPVLRYRRIRRLDGVFLSHRHLDHAGGIPSLIANFRPRRLFIGNSYTAEAVQAFGSGNSASSASVVRLWRGRVIRFGEVELIVLHPPPPGDQNTEQDSISGSISGRSSSDENNLSLTLLLRYRKVGILFPGDLEIEGETELLKSPLSRLLANCRVLKVPHHGAVDSSSEILLKRIDPLLAVISVGRFNHFGHPHHELLERLQKSGRGRLYRTDRHGAVTVVTDGWRLYTRPHRTVISFPDPLRRDGSSSLSPLPCPSSDPLSRGLPPRPNARQ